MVIPKRIIEKWAGKTGAVIDGKVVVGGVNTQEAIANAKKLYPRIKEWEIGILSIPPKEGYWVLNFGTYFTQEPARAVIFENIIRSNYSCAI